MKTSWSTTKVNTQQSLRISRIRLLIAILLVGSVAVFIAPHILRGAVASVLLPGVLFEDWVASSPSRLAQFYNDRQSLVSEIDSLKAELLTARSVDGELAVLRLENHTLRELVGTTSNPLIAAVSARPPLIPYDTVVVAAGSERGVVEGAPVYAGRNTIIGLVSAVYQHHSLVTLISSPDTETTAFVVGPNIYTTARGLGGGMLEIGVPQSISITVGDPVIFPALEPSIFGVVSDVVQVPTEDQQYAYVPLPLALSSILYVRIGREPVPTMTFEAVQAVVAAVRLEAGYVSVPEGVLVDLATTTATGTIPAATSSIETDAL